MKTNETKSMNKAEYAELINQTVADYNSTGDFATRLSIAQNIKTLCDEYNDLSMRVMFTDSLKAEHPILEVAKVYYYDTLTTQDKEEKAVDADGSAVTVINKVVKEGMKKVSFDVYLEWLASTNNTKHIAKPIGYKSAMSDCRNAIETVWTKFFASKGESTTMSKTQVKKSLQTVIDSLVFIPMEKYPDQNALKSSTDHANWLIAFANSRRDKLNDGGKVVIEGVILPRKNWYILIFDVLHNLACNVEKFSIVRGTVDEASKTKTPEVDAKPEAESEESAE